MLGNAQVSTHCMPTKVAYLRNSGLADRGDPARDAVREALRAERGALVIAAPVTATQLSRFGNLRASLPGAPSQVGCPVSGINRRAGVDNHAGPEAGAIPTRGRRRADRIATPRAGSRIPEVPTLEDSARSTDPLCDACVDDSANSAVLTVVSWGCCTGKVPARCQLSVVVSIPPRGSRSRDTSSFPTRSHRPSTTRHRA